MVVVVGVVHVVVVVMRTLQQLYMYTDHYLVFPDRTTATYLRSYEEKA